MREFENGIDLADFLSVKPDAEDLAWDHAMDISASIYSRLKELSMTQKELADMLGVSPGRVSQIIKGEPGMTIRTLAKIETALDLNLSSSFSYYPEAHKPAISSSQRIPRSEHQQGWDTGQRDKAPETARAIGFTCISGGLAA